MADVASYWITTQYPAVEDLERRLAEIRAARRTGSLTINFSQGTPVGAFTWKERLKGPYDSPERHLVPKTGNGSVSG